MTTQQPSSEGGKSDVVLRAAIVDAVRDAPQAHAWSDVERRVIAVESETGPSRRALFVSVAAVSALGIAGVVFALNRVEPATVRTVDPVTTVSAGPVQPPTPSTPQSTSTVPSPVGTVTEPGVEALPNLPGELEVAWSTTIDGGYPESAIRIAETIIFGQQDLPGVSAVDARTGATLWSFTLDDPMPTIVGLSSIDGQVVLTWMNSLGDSIVTAVDLSGAELWTAKSARVVSGGVVQSSVADGTSSMAVLDSEGLPRRSIEYAAFAASAHGQLVVAGAEGSSWYSVPSLERLAGPVAFGAPPRASVAIDGGIVTVEGSVLRFLDEAGVLRSEVEIGPASDVQPVDGVRPGVIVLTPDDPQNNVSGRVAGTTTFYELSDGAIGEVWSRAGIFESIIDVEGRAYVVQADVIDGDPADTVDNIIDVATGTVLASNDLYDDRGAANGFVFAQLDNGPLDLQTVAYDVTGAEMWRIVLQGRERAQIVDRGVLVANVDSGAKTVDLTFYE